MGHADRRSERIAIVMVFEGILNKAQVRRQPVHLCTNSHRLLDRSTDVALVRED